MATDNNQPIKVFSASRYILKLTNLYNKNGIYIRSHQIPNFTFAALILCFSTVFVIFQLSFCIDVKFDLNIMSSPLVYCLATIQSILIFASFLVKRDLMISAIDDLEATVTRSKFIVYLQWIFCSPDRGTFSFH